ncbi:hypothetical protein H5410_040623 [Solanum commersonii]|uniref:Uncharacterized protein n=1 Tax=Solanum commersonii TaxID=4109 RepID=A0A9J5XQN0_SOLCO|nr:hypothetical protein H5410_040623 [Solanum commersonii]
MYNDNGFLGTFMILIDFLKTVISTVEYMQDDTLGTIFNVDKSTSEESTSYSSATPENHDILD